MSGKPFYEDEVTGTYLGTLVEDMIETVAREKKLVCNVHIPELFAKDYNYPLVYVPFWAMSLPLRKGDQVIVQFNQDDYLYPVLYKNPDEIDKGFYEKFEFANVKGNLPQPMDTIGATRIGEDSYVIKTDNYTVIHDGDSFIVLDKKEGVWISGKSVNIITNGGKVTIKNNNGRSLFNILNTALTTLNSSFATQGSPAAHTAVPGQFASQLQELSELME